MSFLARSLRFTRTHGFPAAIQHAGAVLRRLGSVGQHVLFCCDLPLEKPAGTPWVTIEHLLADDSSQTAPILRYGGDTVVARQFRERFQAGARLHLAKVAGDLVAFGWSIRGRTVRPYYFGLSSADVHLFDYVVFPEFRGNGINRLFLHGILSHLGAEGARRAFIECATWNEPQLRSLARTPFRPIGRVRCVHLAGFTMTQWLAPDADASAEYRVAGLVSRSR